MIEVGYCTIGESEFVWREDELVGPAIECLHHTIGTYGCLCGLRHAGTYGTHAVTIQLGLVYQVSSLLSNDHLLRIHLIFGQILYLYFVEVAQTAVQGDVSLVDTVDFHALHQLA